MIRVVYRHGQKLARNRQLRSRGDARELRVAGVADCIEQCVLVIVQQTTVVFPCVFVGLGRRMRPPGLADRAREVECRVSNPLDQNVSAVGEMQYQIPDGISARRDRSCSDPMIDAVKRLEHGGSMPRRSVEGGVQLGDDEIT